MNLHGEWTQAMFRAWMAPFQSDCRRQLALECDAEMELAAWCGMGMATYSSGPAPLQEIKMAPRHHKVGSTDGPAEPYIPDDCDQQGRVRDGRRSMTRSEEEAMDRKVREAYERKPWVPIVLERAKSDAEMSAAFLDSQSGDLADQLAAASRQETWARVVAGIILAGLAALAWWGMA